MGGNDKMSNCRSCGKALYPFEEAFGDGEHCTPCKLEKKMKEKKMQTYLDNKSEFVN